MIFWFVPLENFRLKLNFWKGSPAFPLEIFRWNCVLRVSQRFFSSSRPLSIISSVRKYGGYTERITSKLAMNHTNAKTCLSRGIGGLPNACCWGTLPVCVFQRSLESSWIGFQNINSLTIYADKIFSLKTLISVKIAPHIGCNCCQDTNEIIICINKTLFFQREV